MKIVFVLPVLTVGGGIRVVFEYGTQLQRRGCTVFVVYPLIPPFALRLFKQQGLKNTVKKSLVALKRRQFPLKTTATLLEVPLLSTRILNYKVPDADVVIATGWETALPVYKLAKQKGEKFYFIQHYEIFDVWNDYASWEDAEKVETDSSRLCLAMADIIPRNRSLRTVKELVDATYKLPLKKITISNWLKELLEEKFHQKVEGVVANGVDFSRFDCGDKQLSSGAKRVLAMYSPVKWKGTEDSIKAFELVKKLYPDIEFTMYGVVKGKLPGWIKFYENPSPEMLSKLYCSADIFVSSSWVEGFHLPPMEAMACKCAVVATNVDAVPDYAISGETALIVPPRRHEELAKAIMKLIEDNTLLRSIAENGFNCIKEFTWEKATDKLEAILKMK
jgi:hypothetical protein